MDQRTAEALEASIIKYMKLIARVERGEEVGFHEISSNNCPLCALFLDQEGYASSDCVGCPVMGRTGKRGCADSPWVKLADSVDPPVVSGNLSELQAECAFWLKAELAFLLSLREDPSHAH